MRPVLRAAMLLGGVSLLASGCLAQPIRADFTNPTGAPTSVGGQPTSTGVTTPVSTTRHGKTTTVVFIHYFAFSPSTVTVKAGTTVVWQNVDEIDHSVEAVNHSFNLGTLSPGQTVSKTFTTPGTYSYDSSLQPFMHGTVVVTP